MTAHVFDEFANEGSVTVTESYGTPSTFSQPVTNDTAVPTVYDALRKELSKKPDLPEDVVLKVPGRSNIKVRFSTDLDLDLFDQWRKQSRKGSKKTDDINQIEFYCRFIVHQAICLVFNGKDAIGADGEPLNFRNPDVAEMLGVVGGPLAAVEALYGRDVNILTTGTKLTEACMGEDEEELEEDDPKD